MSITDISELKGELNFTYLINKKANLNHLNSIGTMGSSMFLEETYENAAPSFVIVIII